jgi:7-carboxy-7-deazaguanine synthase
MKISEIFYSLQGEGVLTGTPSVFVRLAGCHLKCRWCDTKYAWDENSGSDMQVDEIVAKIENWDTYYVVITGGEPMLQPELKKLLQNIGDKHITIETAGIIYKPNLNCDLMSISPKLTNAGAEKNEYEPLNIEVLKKLTSDYQYQLKFVVENQRDIDELKQLLKETGSINTDKVLLMPQVKNRSELIEKTPFIAKLCLENGFRFCNRLQIMLWDTKKGI